VSAQITAIDASGSPPLIQTQFHDQIGTITLNQPAKRNALSAALVEQVLTALADFQSASARVVVITAGLNVNVFSAGHDVGELPQGEDPLPYADPLERLLRAVKRFPAPVIAMVHGSVWGGATDLVLSCDMIVGDETSAFAITPANLGLAYNTTGILQCLRRLPLNLVKEMFFTAAPLNSTEAAKWGVLNHLVPAAELEPFTYRIARRIAEKAPLAVTVIKEQLRILTDADPITPDLFEHIQQLRQDVYRSADYQEGLTAFHEKRKPVFTGR
jgi:methylmalonyl-CoA decarboxylase